MTRSVDWGALALLTLRSPSEAAEQVLAFNLSRDVLWSSLALVAVINTILFSLSNILLPTPSPLPAMLTHPLVFFVLVAGGLVVTVHALYWTGRMLGAKGDMGDLLALLIWLQALRAVAQAAVLVLVFVSPMLAAFLVFAAGLAALWILVNFVSVGLRLFSLGRALAVLLAASLALIFGLSLLLSLIGVTAIGIPANV